MKCKHCGHDVDKLKSFEIDNESSFYYSENDGTLILRMERLYEASDLEAMDVLEFLLEKPECDYFIFNLEDARVFAEAILENVK